MEEHCESESQPGSAKVKSLAYPGATAALLDHLTLGRSVGMVGVSRECPRIRSQKWNIPRLCLYPPPWRAQCWQQRAGLSGRLASV